MPCCHTVGCIWCVMCILKRREHNSRHCCITSNQILQVHIISCAPWAKLAIYDFLPIYRVEWDVSTVNTLPRTATNVATCWQILRRLPVRGYSSRSHVTSRWRHKVDVTRVMRRALTSAVTLWHPPTWRRRQRSRSSRRPPTSPPEYSYTPLSPSISRSVKGHRVLNFWSKSVCGRFD